MAFPHFSGFVSAFFLVYFGGGGLFYEVKCNFLTDDLLNLEKLEVHLPHFAVYTVTTQCSATLPWHSLRILDGTK